MTALAASNHHIRRLRRLLGRRSARSDDGAFVLEGPTLIGDALEAGVELEAIFVDETFDDGAITARAVQRGVPTYVVTEGVLAEIADVVTPRPIMAVAPQVATTLSTAVERSVAAERPIVVLIDVRDPGNVGTIIRAAESSGAAAVVCTTGTVDPWSPKVVRSSAGAILYVPVVVGVDADTALDVLGEAGIHRVATLVSGATSYDRVDLSGPVALVFGNEARGLPSTLESSVDLAVTIPMAGRSESLNVAMAASIMCFEALRQRRNRLGEPFRDRTDWTGPPAADKVIMP